MIRAEQRWEDCWAIEDLYASDALWEQDYQKCFEQLKRFSRYKGSLSVESTTLLEAMRELDRLSCWFDRLYVYANQKYHEDTGNAKYQEFTARAARLEAELAQAVSFVEPELTRLSEEQLEVFLAEKPELEMYRRKFQEYMRRKPHILSEEMEELLALAGEMAQAPKNVFTMFQNADLKLGSFTMDGEEIVLTQGNYIRCMESPNQEMRRKAFELMYKKYEEFQNTLASAYAGNLAQDIFYAKARKYSSSLAMAMDESKIPEQVYTRLIDAVHRKLPAMYRYVSLRKKLLGVEELHMYDVYVPLVEPVTKEISFETAKEMVLEGLQVLGEDYVELLKEGFANRWIDVYENKGKQGGAYSWGAYGTHPYVLLNYQKNLNDVFTLAHEMGHALHTYHSNQAQPYTYANYLIFVAEVASTCNEALLIYYLLDHAKDEKEKAYLLNYSLDQFKGTVFRQTMFAEFELLAHERAEQGEGVTAQMLSELYYELNQKYFGSEMVSDPLIALEWAKIPHFYTSFYVYQYATGFSAAVAIARKILAGEPGILEAYKKFLSGGNSMDCIDLLKLCGIDMTKPDTVEMALEVFEQRVAELEALLVKPENA